MDSNEVAKGSRFFGALPTTCPPKSAYNRNVEIHRFTAVAVVVLVAGCGAKKDPAPAAPAAPKTWSATPDGKPQPWRTGQFVSYHIANGAPGATETLTVGGAGEVGFELDRVQKVGKKKNASQALFAPAFQGSAVRMPSGRDGTLKITLFAARDGRAVTVDMPIHVQVAKRSGGEAIFTKGDARAWADCFLVSLCHGIKTEDFAAPGQSHHNDYGDHSMAVAEDPNADEATLMIRLAALRVLEKLGNDPTVVREDLKVPGGTFLKAVKFRVDVRLDSTVRQATVWAHSSVPITGAVKVDTGGLALELLDASAG